MKRQTNGNQITMMLNNYCENDIICAYVMNCEFPRVGSRFLKLRLNTLVFHPRKKKPLKMINEV